jgi:hypothetical protein
MRGGNSRQFIPQIKRQIDDVTPFLRCVYCYQHFTNIIKFQEHFSEKHLREQIAYQCACGHLTEYLDHYKLHLTLGSHRCVGRRPYFDQA